MVIGCLVDKYILFGWYVLKGTFLNELCHTSCSNSPLLNSDMFVKVHKVFNTLASNIVFYYLSQNVKAPFINSNKFEYR